MKTTRVREVLAAGGVVLNGWCVMPGGFLAEVMANLGWDALTLDMQHGLIAESDMLPMLQGISTTSVTPVVRVPSNDPATIGKALDAGALGVICPLVNSRAEAEQFVAACRYPPHGVRSSGPTRAILQSGNSYLLKANDEILKFVMVETRQGLENLDEIAATPGLDGIYVGPSDLSLALGGFHGYDKDEPVMIDAYKRVIEACQRNEIIPAAHTASADFAARMAQMGFRWVTIVGDMNFILAGGRVVGAARKMIAGDK